MSPHQKFRTRHNIKTRRVSLGLSQRALARRLRCSRSHVANMENGHRPFFDWLGSIATALHTKRKFLVAA